MLSISQLAKNKKKLPFFLQKKLNCTDLEYCKYAKTIIMCLNRPHVKSNFWQSKEEHFGHNNNMVAFCQKRMGFVVASASCGRSAPSFNTDPVIAPKLDLSSCPSKMSDGHNWSKHLISAYPNSPWNLMPGQNGFQLICQMVFL